MSSFSIRSSWLPAMAAAAIALLTIADRPLLLAQGQNPSLLQRLDTKLREARAGRPETPQRVIIRVRRGHESAVRQVLASRGGQVLAEHGSLGALTAVVRTRDLDVLAREDRILSVSADAVVTPHQLQLGGLLGGVTKTLSGLVGGVTQTTGTVLSGLVDTVVTIIDPAGTSGPPVPPQILRETLGLGSSQWTGRGVGVAIIDSGLTMSDDFRGRVTAFYDMTGGRTVATQPFDDYGHGTHVAGIIASSGALSSGRTHRGLAPGVTLTVIKVLDATGAGYTSDVVRALDFVTANRRRFGIDIVNLSLGHPIYEPAASDPLVQAVERASRAGLIVMASAGNLGRHATTGLQGYGGITSPGNAPSAITVGAVASRDTVRRDDDRIADYSSAGPTWYDAQVKPDIVAPGHNIVASAARRSTLYQTYPQLAAADPDYMRLSGTSMSAAVATGVVAQMLEAHRAPARYDDPDLTPNAVKAALHYTALDVWNDLGLPYSPLRQGAGGLNGRGAVETAAATDTGMPAGSVWLRPLPAPWTTIGGQPLLWKQAVIWGDTVIWGDSIVFNRAAWSTAVIWGDTVIWGDAVIWGDTVIWGDNVVWDDPNAWSTAVIWGSHTIGQSNGSTVIWGSSGQTEDQTVWKRLDAEDVRAASGR